MGRFLRWGNWLVAKLLQVLFGGPSLSDCGCTLRLIHRDAYLAIRDRFTVGGSHFLPEMVCLALLRGLRVVEVPVNYRGRVGESKITGSLRTTLRVGLRMIALILRYWIVGQVFGRARAQKADGRRRTAGGSSAVRPLGSARGRLPSAVTPTARRRC